MRTERGSSKKRTRDGRKKNDSRTRNYRKLDEKLPNLWGMVAFSSRTRWVMLWRENVPWNGSFSLSQMSRIKLALIMPWPENDGCNPTFSLSQMSRTELVRVIPWRENVPRSGTDEWSKSNPGLFELVKLCMSGLCFTEEGANANDWYGLNS